MKKDISQEKHLSMLQMVDDLKKQLAQLSEKCSRSGSELILHDNEALSSHLLTRDYPPEWWRPKLPNYNGRIDPEDDQLPNYNGNIDPEDDLQSFVIRMEDVITQEDICHRMFRRTLKEETLGWYQGLLKGSIHTFLI